MRTSNTGILFIILLALALVGALRGSTGSGSGARSIARAAIAPLARPLSESGESVRAWFGSARRPETSEIRSDEALEAENAQLRAEVESLAGQLTALSRLNADRDRVGPLRQFTTAVRVSGMSPAGDRLLLSGEAVTPGVAALHASGLVGRVDASGRGVELLTSPGFKAVAVFTRWSLSGVREDLTIEPAVLVGRGDGTMTVARYRLSQVGDEGLRPGDLAVLSDEDFPLAVQGLRLARVTSIEPAPEAPGFVTVNLEPTTDLTRLSEVMVLRE